MCNVFPEVKARETETSASAKKTWLSEPPQAFSTGAFLPVMCIKEKVQLTFVSLLTTGYLGLAFWWLSYFLPLVCFKKNVLAILPFPVLWPSFCWCRSEASRSLSFPKSHSCAWRSWNWCTLSTLTNVLLEKLFPAEILDLLFVADSFQALQFCALRWILSVGKNMVTLETRSLEQQSNYSTITRVY